MNRYIQIFHKTTNNDDLLGIFLAKEGFVCTGKVNELRYNGSYAAEMNRPAGTAKFVRDVAFDSDIRTISFGIHL